MGKGLRSMGGKHDSESRQMQSADEFAGPVEEDFVPLKDEELSRSLPLSGDSLAGGSLAQSSLAPGEPGSSLPGIHAFSDPTKLSLGHIFQPILFD